MPTLLQNPARAVAAIFFLCGAFFGAWASRIPSIKSQFQLSADDLGLLLLLLAVGAIVSFPIAGEAINRHGAVKTTRIMAWGYGASLLLLGLSPSITLLAISLFIFGFTHGALDVAMNAWGAEVEKHADKPIMPGLHAVFSIGAGVGALLGSYAILLEFNVKTHFLGFGIITTLLCMAMASIHWQSVIVGKSGSAKIFALPKGGLIFVGVIALCTSLGEGAMADWSGVYLIENIGTDESFAGLGYAAFSVTMVIIRFSGGWFVSKTGNVMAVRICGLLALAGVLIVVFSTDAYTVIAGFGIIGMGYALIMPLAFSRAANDNNQPAGTAIAGMATLGYGGLLLGPPVIGFLAEIYSLNTAFFLLAGLAVVVIFSAKAMKPQS